MVTVMSSNTPDTVTKGISKKKRKKERKLLLWYYEGKKDCEKWFMIDAKHYLKKKKIKNENMLKTGIGICLRQTKNKRR